MQPRQSRETSRPVRPNFTYSMANSPINQWGERRMRFPLSMSEVSSGPLLDRVDDKPEPLGRRCEHTHLLPPPRSGRNYPPPCRCKKLRSGSHIAECRSVEGNGKTEFARWMFGLRSVTFQKRRSKRLRDSSHYWHRTGNYFQRGSGSILA